MTIKSQYKGVGKALRMYWDVYGGASALATSPFFHGAILLMLLCLPLWWGGAWWERSIAVLPSVLGFSIAAFTLMLGVGDEAFRRRLGLQRRTEKPSTLTNTSASLLHFIVVQIVALSIALVASARPMQFLIEHGFLSNGLHLVIVAKAFRAFGFFLLCYALFTALAATLSIFRLATLFSAYVTKNTPLESSGHSGEGAPRTQDDAGA